MRPVFRILAAALACALAALSPSGCSTEDRSLTLAVSASPNPVAGVAVDDGRRWSYRISIVNTSPVAVVVESYHTEITATDTGYVQPLQVVVNSPIIGQRIEPGAAADYDASRDSGGDYSRGRERRLYHARGEDGIYYSGEVTIDLQ